MQSFAQPPRMGVRWSHSKLAVSGLRCLKSVGVGKNFDKIVLNLLAN